MDTLENLIRSTININTIDKKGNGWTGTGFIYHFNLSKGSYFPVIVTNKHVVKGMDSGEIQFSIQDDTNKIIPNKFFTVTISDIEKQCILHPDTEIDLCILPIAAIYKNMSENNINYYIGCIRELDVITEQELENLSVVEEVLMVGYPDGLKDNINNIPIVRQGLTATPLKYDYKGLPITLLDIPVYGGSSGSPVFLKKQLFFKIDGKINYGYKLLGIVNSVYQHSVEGEVKNKTLEKVISLIPNNVGIMIKANQLSELEKICIKLSEENHE